MSSMRGPPTGSSLLPAPRGLPPGRPHDRACLGDMCGTSGHVWVGCDQAQSRQWVRGQGAESRERGLPVRGMQPGRLESCCRTAQRQGQSVLVGGHTHKNRFELESGLQPAQIRIPLCISMIVARAQAKGVCYRKGKIQIAQHADVELHLALKATLTLKVTLNPTQYTRHSLIQV